MWKAEALGTSESSSVTSLSYFLVGCFSTAADFTESSATIKNWWQNNWCWLRKECQKVSCDSSSLFLFYSPYTYMRDLLFPPRLLWRLLSLQSASLKCLALCVLCSSLCVRRVKTVFPATPVSSPLKMTSQLPVYTAHFSPWRLGGLLLIVQQWT